MHRYATQFASHGRRFQAPGWLVRLACLLALLCAGSMTDVANAQERTESSSVLSVEDRPWDNGDSLQVEITLAEAQFEALTAEEPTATLLLAQGGAYGELYSTVAEFPPNDGGWEVDDKKRQLTRRISELSSDHEYFYRVLLKNAAGEVSLLAETETARSPERQWFLGDKLTLAIVGIVICGSVILFIEIAKTGRELKVRKIAGLEAVDEAVGRATEMGRSVLYVPGIQDMNDIQTIAGLNILSHVARVAAEFDAKVEVPTSRALVMTAARETLQGSYMTAGRPDAYMPDLAYYVTDEQFGYVAFVSGKMVREKPAACFYLGAFFAESLILAETGNSVGAIQVAGTAQPSQLPFFVAACDYTLIGEELFAASAYLSGSPEELGSLKGQDVGKIIAAIGMIGGCLWLTLEKTLLFDGSLWRMYFPG